MGTASPGWNASLSEHVLKNLRTADITMTEKELQDNLTMLEKKLRYVVIRNDLIINDSFFSLLVKAKFFNKHRQMTMTCQFMTKFVNCNSQKIFSHFQIKIFLLKHIGRPHFTLKNQKKNDKTIASDVSL